MLHTSLYLARLSESAIRPERSTIYSAGYDIRADLANVQEVETLGRKVKVFRPDNTSYEIDTLLDYVDVPSGHRALVPTGWKMQCEVGKCIKLYPRSGHALKAGIRLANGTGIVDADYPNEVGVIIHNTSERTFTIQHGDAIAQMMVEDAINVSLLEVDELPELISDRTGGFGSTSGKDGSND